MLNSLTLISSYSDTKLKKAIFNSNKLEKTEKVSVLSSPSASSPPESKISKYAHLIDKLLLAKSSHTPTVDIDPQSDKICMEIEEFDLIQLIRIVGDDMGWGLNKRSGDLGLFPLNICVQAPEIVEFNTPKTKRKSTSVNRLTSLTSRKKLMPIMETSDPIKTNYAPMPEEREYLAIKTYGSTDVLMNPKEDYNLELTVWCGDRVELLRMLQDGWGFFRNKRSGELGPLPMNVLRVYNEEEEDTPEILKLENASLARIPTFKSLNDAVRRSEETLSGSPEQVRTEISPEPSTILNIVTEPHLQLSAEQIIHMLNVKKNDRVEVVKPLGHGWILGRNLKTGDIGAMPLTLTDWKDLWLIAE
ncbi:hypothetical protein HK096_008523 [Nowakowskiella sp. JEL0078]|nr:hypothetical protein HK096_008523 [Nowakowskiella sp. JEL0078]